MFKQFLLKLNIIYVIIGLFLQSTYGYELKLVKQSENNYSKNYLCAENGSCYGDKSLKTGKPKNTHVKGYFRKDGTYVRGHYRSR